MIKWIIRTICLLLACLGLYKAFTIHQSVEQVLTYRSLVREVLAEQDTKANEDLILAMIYTETKGKTQDVMQASESVSGQTNTILDDKESIRRGVETLSKDLDLAQDKGVDVWTAIQAYNFGDAYIDYISEHGQKTSIELAKTYSREVVAPSLGNTSGATYAYWNPIALFDGCYLYVNGGNYYYAKQVHLHLYFLKMMSFF